MHPKPETLTSQGNVEKLEKIGRKIISKISSNKNTVHENIKIIRLNTKKENLYYHIKRMRENRFANFHEMKPPSIKQNKKKLFLDNRRYIRNKNSRTKLQRVL